MTKPEVIPFQKHSMIFSSQKSTIKRIEYYKLKIKNMKRIIFTLIIGALVWGCQQKEAVQTENKKANDRILVKIQPVKDQINDVTLNYSGLAEPMLTVPLSFQVPGKVMHINLDEGDAVKKGQVIATLDKTSYQSAYNAALAMQDQAQDAYDRLKTVHEKGSLPAIKWEEVKSKLEQAKSSANIARKNLEDCNIISPITGLVGSRSIEVGATATPGITVFKIISTNDLYVRISVPDNEINRIEKSQVATINFPALGGKTFKGTVDKIGVVANTISKTFEVKLKIDNASSEIKPGMICDINLPLKNTSPKLLVPIQSVMKDARGENYVFVVDKQNQTAHQQVVKTAGIINNQLCITSGLKGGDYLVVEGQHKLTNQAKVKFN